MGDGEGGAALDQPRKRLLDLRTLLRCTGKRVELHYKEYFGRLPWRGYNKHIVDRIGQIYDEYEDNYERGRTESQIYL